MALMYGVALVLIAVLCIGLQFVLKLRMLGADRTGRVAQMSPDRYRPMLRLLSDEDLDFVRTNSRLRRSVRAARRALFRDYLRCLTRDYSCLLADVRHAMVQSGVDRPDLARALAKNRVLFAIAVCKLEYRLALHAAGIGHVEIAGIVEALELLSRQVSTLSSTPQSA